jgi:uncharacterized protein YcsI (UPF0317 family)
VNGNSTAHFEWQGPLISSVRRKTSEFTYTYDESAQLIQIQSIFDQSHGKPVNFGYDSVGKATTIGNSVLIHSDHTLQIIHPSVSFPTQN